MIGSVSGMIGSVHDGKGSIGYNGGSVCGVRGSVIVTTSLSQSQSLSQTLSPS